MKELKTKLVRSQPLEYNPDDWKPLGEGTYNKVFRSSRPLALDPKSDYHGHWVLKFPKMDVFALRDLSDEELSQLKKVVVASHRLRHSKVRDKFLVSTARKRYYRSLPFSLEEAKLIRQVLDDVGRSEISAQLSFKEEFAPFNGSERGRRILSEMYGDTTRLPQASVRRLKSLDATLEASYAWAVPFVDGVQATDDEMARELVNIYRKTRRIVVDAPAPKNFLTMTFDDDSKATFCVDVDWALRRSNSRLSFEATDDVYGHYEGFWAEHYAKRHTISTIMTLLCLEAYLDPGHELDEHITPYVIDALRYVRRTSEHRSFRDSLLINLHFLECASVKLNAYWYEAVLSHLTNDSLITDFSHRNLLMAESVVGDDPEDRGMWFDALAALSAEGKVLNEHNVRTIRRSLSSGRETLQESLVSLLELFNVDSLPESLITEPAAEEPAVSISYSSSPLSMKQASAVGFFAPPETAKREDDVPEVSYIGALYQWVSSLV